MKQYIEELNFLENGYSILATRENGTVLASRVYEREEGEEDTMTVSSNALRTAYFLAPNVLCEVSTTAGNGCTLVAFVAD